MEEKVYADWELRGYTYKYARGYTYKQIYLVNIITSKRKQMLYSRYLMEVHLNQYLPRSLQVHHKDENSLNDVIENLEIKTIGNHRREHNYTPDSMELVCEDCGNTYIIKKKSIYNRRSSTAPKHNWCKGCRIKNISKVFHGNQYA